MGCWNNIIGAQFSRPVMGIVYNGVTSAYLMSGRQDSFTPRQWEDGLANLTMTDYVTGDKELGVPSLDERMIKHYGSVERHGPALLSSLFQLLPGVAPVKV